MDKIRQIFFGWMYRQRLNVIRNLIEEISDEADGVNGEKIVEELLYRIGKLKIAKDAAEKLLNDLEDELRSKLQFEDISACTTKAESEVGK